MDPTALTAMVDRVFGDRYRIDQLIGAGAISAVFVAVDEVDGRRVALKVFDRSLAEDERFVDRLLAAVEAAAEVSHPNLVEVMDWGFDDGVYIVTELCEGGSLASLLAEGHTLAPSQALVVGLETSRALAHGHDHGLVHRSLTPRTVLFTDDQRVRIADLGLAKVLSEAPAGQAARALENVRYASPEQARGRPVEASSDLYSLALVLSEAVSANPPQVADTVVGTLMDRAESPAKLDPALGPLLATLERCGRVDPDERPETDEFSIALLAAAESMPRPEPLPLVGIGHGEEEAEVVSGADDTQGDLLLERQTERSAAVGGDPDEVVLGTEAGAETRDSVADTEIDDDSADGIDDGFDVSVLGELDEIDAFADDSDGSQPVIGAADHESGIDETADIAADDGPAVDAPLGGLDNLEEAEQVFAEVPGTEVTSRLDVPEPVAARRAAPPAYEEQEDDADDRLPWWPLALLVALIAGGVGAAVYFFALQGTIEAATVPDLIGLQYDELDDAIDEDSWQIDRLESRVDGSAPGVIVQQSPEPGERLEDGGMLTVTVSLGNQMVEIPSDIIGLTVEQAASRLGVDGLLVGSVTEANNEELQAGLVIGVNEPTTQLPRGEEVDLLVSTGPEDRVVPDNVIGMSIGDATGMLVGLRLQAVEEPIFDPDAELGTVLDAIPGPGEVVPADSAVRLIVSAGPEPVEMPDIVDLELDEARDVIEELGLVFIDVEGTPGEPVIGSLPPIGATVDVGTEVTIILGDPPDDEDDE